MSTIVNQLWVERTPYPHLRDGGGCVLATDYEDENKTAFIVRAVNSHDALRQFVLWALECAADGRDADGDDIQSQAVKCGLLKAVPYDPERHTLPDWIDGVERGDDYYEWSDLLKAGAP